MSKVIEILDSDDDSASKADEPTPIEPSTSGANNITAIKQTTQTQAEATAQAEPTTQAEPATKFTTSSIKNRNRSRRKSVLQPIRTSPDMQFETISLDEDDDEDSRKSTSVVGPLAAGVLPQKTKTGKTVPKILVAKPPTTEELVNAAFESFLDSEETTTLVRQIAEERARVNYLLATNNLPEIEFSLYTNPERLRFQLENRLKQREISNSYDTQEVLQAKRRRRQLDNAANSSD